MNTDAIGGHGSAPKIVYAGGYSGSSDYPVHTHENAWELIYLREGAIDEIANKDVLGLSPGMFVVHSPGTIHGDLAHSEYFLYHVLVATDHPEHWPKLGRDLEASPIGALLGMIVHEWHNGWVHRETFLRHSALLLDVLMRRCVVMSEETSIALSVVTRVRGIFRRDFRQSINMGELAAELDISRSTLYAYFHQVLARTPQEVLDEIRLRHAVFLLRHSQLSIGSIAQGSGFCSASHLGRKLRKIYQRSASEIREAPVENLSK